MRQLPIWSGLLPLATMVVLLGAAMLFGLDLWTVWIVRDEARRSLAAAVRTASADGPDSTGIEGRIARELAGMGFMVAAEDLELRSGPKSRIAWHLDVPLQLGFLAPPRLEIEAPLPGPTGLALPGGPRVRWLVYAWTPGPGAEDLQAAIEARRALGEEVLAVLGTGEAAPWLLVRVGSGSVEHLPIGAELDPAAGVSSWNRLMALPGLGSPRTLRVLAVPADP